MNENRAKKQMQISTISLFSTGEKQYRSFTKVKAKFYPKNMDKQLQERNRYSQNIWKAVILIETDFQDQNTVIILIKM